MSRGLRVMCGCGKSFAASHVPVMHHLIVLF
jgi:hypothetical protein